MQKVVISGTGVFTPPFIISNDEIVASFNTYVEHYNQRYAVDIAAGSKEAMLPSSSSFIEKASGIKQRYVLDKQGILDTNRMRPYFAPRQDEEPSLQCEISLKAIQQALQQANISALEVDAIILACSNFQRAYPGMAIEIAHYLGSNAFGLDMNVACSSATFGLAAAYGLIQSQQAKTVVMVNPEICSGHLDFTDRESHFIFGDACSAVVIQEKSQARVPHFDILSTKLTTQFSNNLRNNQGFLTHTETKSNTDIPQYKFRQNGRKVFKEVIPLVCDHLEAHFSKEKLGPSDIKRLWLHQANQGMNELIAKKTLNKDFNQIDAPVILDRYANTSSAGSIICFHEKHQDFQSGEMGVICSFGGGYSIGSVLVQKA